jgi:peptide-methionine (S)-S-oxide reductase
MEKAMFGAGCFWGVEAGFRSLDGVHEAYSGYSGGETDNPTYEQVCTGTTNHTEVVLVEFDPDVITFERLLEVFWNGHDPTTLNRQGPDVGTQYRSAIYYYTDAQKEAAEASVKALNDSGQLRNPVTTEIAAARQFYMAEDYHQKYFEKRGIESCHFGVN